MAMSEMDEKLQKILPLVQKPIRYIDGEYNLLIKEKRPDSITFCLIFPDIYEVGMSNYGLKILYHLLNQDPSVIVERAYAPWPDFAQFLRKNNLPLYSLETKTPLRNFHILGFSLQSELSYPTVLYILDLAGIPLRAEERKDSDPLIIAGGPCCVNPLPVADFFDAFCIGDGEDVVKEIVEVYRHSHSRSREEILSSLAKVEGIYVPSRGKNQVKRRIKEYLGEEEFPFPPIVPICDIVHDRLTIEVMRGCTRGCRFCQAGMINRPVRWRKPEEILRLAERGIRSSGWEEVSLLAFSVSDYPDLPDLLSQLNSLLYKKRVAISLPSMRGEDFSLSLAQKLKAIKKTGLTFAPETISSRLKGLINKDIKEERIFQALAAAAETGWLGVKLYFMIGLPAEKEEDVREIAKFVLSCARSFKKMQIRFSLSPFIPKPHTPLQWQPFSEIKDLEEKIDLLKRETKRGNIRLKWENPYQAQIQAILARGDEKLAHVIFSAYKRGAIFAEWSEFFNYQHWEESFQEAGIDFHPYLEGKPIETPLPWDFIDIGVSKDFLRREALRAEDAIFTPDCRQTNCLACGVCPPGKKREEESIPEKLELGIPPGYERKVAAGTNKKITYRVKYAVGESFLFASHLDIVRQFYRVLRRSELPVIFSSGFSPHPLISFGPPLPVGISSRGEYLDIQLAASYSGNLTRDLAPFLPKGIMILETRVLRKKVDSLGKVINLAEYEIKFPPTFPFDEQKIIARWKRFPAIFRVDLNREGLVIFVAVAPGVRLFPLLAQLFECSENEVRLLSIERKDSYILRNGKIFTPLEDV
jgi:radical SAM-linked protein